MDIKLSPQTIDLLADIISGGSQAGNGPPIGIYRSGPKLEKFMRECNVNFHIGGGSRVPSLVECIELINKNWHDDDQERLTKIIERATDPRDFLSDPERGKAVFKRLNEALNYDDLQLVAEGRKHRLVRAGQGTVIAASLVTQAEIFSFDTVQRDLNRALDTAENDPEVAVTAACSTIESMCRSVLAELGEPLPTKEDVQGLYRAIRKPLGISPEREDFPPEIAADVRKILSGLVTATEGIGALRTHGGSAHGRTRGTRRIDPRIARLAIHASITVAMFILETWQHKHPNKALTKHAADEKGNAS